MTLVGCAFLGTVSINESRNGTVMDKTDGADKNTSTLMATFGESKSWHRLFRFIANRPKHVRKKLAK